jgi:outer membrane receptor for ferrienterochelin and colicins
VIRRRSGRVGLTVLVALLMTASAAFAQPLVEGEGESGGVAEEDTVVEPDEVIEADEVVVVTGAKTEQREWESTVPIEAIPRHEIESVATVNIENVLRQIPGIYTRRNEQFGLGASTIRMQGADPNKVAILQNNRRFRGGIGGVVDLRDIAVSNVERIELMRGPGSTLYGSDAMVGVLNIITREGSEELVAEGVAGWGDFGRQFYSVAHGWQVGPVRYFLTGVHDEFRLAEQFGDISAQFADPDLKQERNQLTGRFDFDVGEDHSFSIEPSYLEEGNPQSNEDNLVVGSEWNWQVAEQTELVTWFNNYRFARTNDLPGFEENNDYQDYEGESRLMHRFPRWSLWDENLVTAGVRARQQHLNQEPVQIEVQPVNRTCPEGSRQVGTQCFVTQPPVDESIWQASPFLQTDITITPQWKLNLGSSFDVNQRSGLAVNPRGTLTWFPFQESLRLSATVGRGFRSPDLLQLYGIDINLGGTYAVLGNPDLEPERSTGYDLEAEWKLPGFTGFLSFFRNDFEELIVTPLLLSCPRTSNPTPQCRNSPLPGIPLIFKQENVASALTQGVELGLEFSLLDLMEIDNPYQLLFGVGYAYVDSENQNGIEGEDGNDLPFRPRNRVVPGLTLRRIGWGMDLAFWAEYEDDAFTDVANSEEGIARNHWVFNMAYHIEPFRTLPFEPQGKLGALLDFGRRLGFFVQGENLLDTEYGTLTADGRLAGPRAFLFGVTAKY